jgi:putative transposase
MKYPAAEKLEIIRLVEQSPLPVRRTLAQLGIRPATFYRWYDRRSSSRPEALNDRSPRPDRVWNRIPDSVRDNLIQLALDEPALSPRELAVRFTDTKSYFVSEASVYRLLKAHNLIASPAFIVIKAADAFNDKTTAPNQLWHTDFTYLKVIGWGWCDALSCRRTRPLPPSCAMWSGSISTRRPTVWCCRSMRSLKSKSSAAPSPACRSTTRVGPGRDEDP